MSERPNFFRIATHRSYRQHDFSIAYVLPDAVLPIPELAVRQLRQKTLNYIKTGRPISIARFEKYGDNLVYRWSIDYVLRKLCNEESLDSANIKLNTYDPLARPLKHGLDLSREVVKSPAIKSYIFPFHNYFEHLSFIACALGVELEYSDLFHVPQPLRSDHPPFNHFDKAIVTTRGDAIRDHLKRPIITVAQSGSESEKRFSDEQVLGLAEAAKEIFPEGQVVIVSDKKFVKNDSDSLGQKYQKTDARVVITSSMNEIAANFYASDLLIVTDSFWSWLGAGSIVMRQDRQGEIRPQDVISLHTLASDEKWGIPNATTISHPLLRVSGNIWGFISREKYQINHNGSPENKGIHQDDIELLRQSIRKAARSYRYC